MCTEIIIKLKNFGYGTEKSENEIGTATKWNEHWPEDLMIKILLRLPVKSIIRFKCVAKTWKSLFESSGFVSQKLSISKEANNRLILYLSGDRTLASYQDLLPQIPQHVNAENLQIRVHDGLLCLCDANNSRISLWNPATREFRLLPKCNKNIPSNARKLISLVSIGVGSDSFKNDYKVIYIREYNYIRRLHIAVYRMSTNSWKLLVGKDIVDIFEGLHIHDGNSSACVNGVYYWVVTKFQLYKVLAFNFSNEVFQLIGWPPDPEPKLYAELLRLPNNHISLWLPDYGMTSISHDIWVLDEDGKNWSKFLRIGPFSGIERVFGFWNKNLNKVYVVSVDGELLLYNLDTQEFINTGIKAKSGLDFLEVFTFEESLISVGKRSNGVAKIGPRFSWSKSCIQNIFSSLGGRRVPRSTS